MSVLCFERYFKNRTPSVLFESLIRKLRGILTISGIFICLYFFTFQTHFSVSRRKMEEYSRNSWVIWVQVFYHVLVVYRFREERSNSPSKRSVDTYDLELPDVWILYVCHRILEEGLVVWSDVEMIILFTYTPCLKKFSSLLL